MPTPIGVTKLLGDKISDAIGSEEKVEERNQ